MTSKEPAPIRYDAHCHVLSREVFFKRNMILLIDATRDYELKKLIKKTPTNEKEREKADRIHILKLMELMLQNEDGTETFGDLRTEYSKLDPAIQKYIPLMVDFEYLFRKKYNASDETIYDSDKRKDQFAKMLGKFNNIRDDIKKLLAKENSGADKDKIELLTRFINETENKSNPEGTNVSDAYLEDEIKSYGRQLETFSKLKFEFKDDFLPFLAIDPRRPGMMKTIIENVGPGKTFTGIKLYPPMGYSPTDPFLYGKNDKDDCLYRYCIEKQIPIIAHCSAGGFCTFVQHLEVIGAVMPEMKFDSVPIVYTQITEIKFKTNVLKSFGDAVKERAYKLNHPKLWEMVLDKFPTLKINLAHFGGDPDVYGNERREYIFKLMTKKDKSENLIYPNLFTDLSCIMEYSLLKDIYDNKFSKIKDRVMYGSDYFLNLIWGDDFNTYYQNFKDVFGGELDRIERGNVEGFLEPKGFL